jgi:predicted RNase H-like nuclease (RuvC/YqgF family)
MSDAEARIRELERVNSELRRKLQEQERRIATLEQRSYLFFNKPDAS